MAPLPQLARIFAAPRSATQSGRARAGTWTLEFRPAEAKRLDPLTGWFGSGDVQGQLRLSFATREEAVAYAETHGIAHEVEAEPPARAIRPRAYADNFRHTRGENWTH